MLLILQMYNLETKLYSLKKYKYKIGLEKIAYDLPESILINKGKLFADIVFRNEYKTFVKFKSRDNKNIALFNSDIACQLGVEYEEIKTVNAYKEHLRRSGKTAILVPCLRDKMYETLQVFNHKGMLIYSERLLSKEKKVFIHTYLSKEVTYAFACARLHERRLNEMQR